MIPGGDTLEFVKKERTRKAEEKVDIAQRMLSWPECYYRERNALIRKQLLDEADRQGLTPEENVFRRKLFDLRYDKKLGPEGEPIDNYVKAWMELRFLSEGGEGLLSRGNVKKLDKVMNGLGFGMTSNREEENLLFQEIYHLGLLYIALCQEDKNYNSVLFGFGTISGEKQAAKVAGEVRRVGKVPFEKYHREEEYSAFFKALKEAYYDMYPDFEGTLD